MITNLKEAKAKLSALIASVETGEDVVITVRGKPAARLSRMPLARRESMTGWKKELEVLHRKYGAARPREKGRSVLDSIREERC